ncbi:hypothetical protein [Glaciimonas soli]|uniref:Uncharacterized protein n=1 Tax=Glaciimonas soli TaxID=2590999 RepID=A0A843YTC5_9BURK|nr:hypothetical protein [Glaciimonas soli]MQR00748.1 hypothetical protein [Glaciimonas soli]
MAARFDDANGGYSVPIFFEGGIRRLAAGSEDIGETSVLALLKNHLLPQLIGTLPSNFHPVTNVATADPRAKTARSGVHGGQAC